MPRLLFFAVCQKPIIDREDGSISLMTIINGLKLPAQVEQPVSSDAATSFGWGAVAQWRQVPEDAGKTYEQRIQIIRPDGTGSGDSVILFAFLENIHTNAIRGDSFPVGPSGEYTVRLSVREVGDQNEWEDVANWPIDVIHE